MPAADDAGARPPAELTYAEATAELDAVIAEFEEGHVDVDRLADRFQRATELVEELDRRIRLNRRKVESLTPRLEAVANGRGPAATSAAAPADVEDEDEDPTGL